MPPCVLEFNRNFNSSFIKLFLVCFLNPGSWHLPPTPSLVSFKKKENYIIIVLGVHCDIYQSSYNIIVH
jgi:hypothetical protein